ncbi:MAG TPA: hypothetical protein VF258_06570 [Luteolibacter sp.]
MKTILHQLTAIALFAVAALPETKAANVTLDGYGFYSLGRRLAFHPEPGLRQSGRKPYLGGGYYHKAEIGMDFITNRSTRRSGDLSLELWAMPYYGATSGVILMTKGMDSLGGGRFYRDRSLEGFAVQLDRRRFPELSLWEFTRRGWKFRDALSFTRKTYL